MIRLKCVLILKSFIHKQETRPSNLHVYLIGKPVQNESILMLVIDNIHCPIRQLIHAGLLLHVFPNLR